MKTEKINLFISKEELMLIDKASKIEGRSRSNFMVHNAFNRAKEIITECGG